MTLRLTALLLLPVLLLAGCAGPLQARAESLGLGQHGELVLQAPAGWKMQQTSADEAQLPTVRLSPEVGDEFLVLVSAITRTESADPEFGAPEAVYQIVASAARDTQPAAVEPELKILEIGDGMTGYFFWATDRKLADASRIPPGEYLYVTQGALMVGDLLCVFTILTNERPSGVIDQALEMLRGAQHRVEM